SGDTAFDEGVTFVVADFCRSVLRRLIAHCPNVLQDSIAPFWNPRLNQSIRCCDVPCVNESGATWPVDIFCNRSSPTAAAAPNADWTSPCSNSPRCCVE